MNPLWKRNARMTFFHLELRFQREFRVLTQLFLKYRYVFTQNCKRKTVPEALDLLPHVGICVSVFYDVYNVSGPFCTQKSPFPGIPFKTYRHFDVFSRWSKSTFRDPEFDKWFILGSLWTHWVPLWSHWGSPWAHWGSPWPQRGSRWGRRGSPWAHWGPLWAHWGPLRKHWGTIWKHWCPLGIHWDTLWIH